MFKLKYKIIYLCILFILVNLQTNLSSPLKFNASDYSLIGNFTDICTNNTKYQECGYFVYYQNVNQYRGSCYSNSLCKCNGPFKGELCDSINYSGPIKLPNSTYPGIYMEIDKVSRINGTTTPSPTIPTQFNAPLALGLELVEIEERLIVDNTFVMTTPFKYGDVNVFDNMRVIYSQDNSIRLQILTNNDNGNPDVTRYGNSFIEVTIESWNYFRSDTYLVLIWKSNLQLSSINNLNNSNIQVSQTPSLANNTYTLLYDTDSISMIQSDIVITNETMGNGTLGVQNSSIIIQFNDNPTLDGRTNNSRAATNLYDLKFTKYSNNNGTAYFQTSMQRCTSCSLHVQMSSITRMLKFQDPYYSNGTSSTDKEVEELKSSSPGFVPWKIAVIVVIGATVLATVGYVVYRFKIYKDKAWVKEVMKPSPRLPDNTDKMRKMSKIVF